MISPRSLEVERDILPVATESETAGPQSPLWLLYRTLMDYPDALVAVQQAFSRAKAEGSREGGTICPKCGCGGNDWE